MSVSEVEVEADAEPILSHHFDDPEQQHESSMLGMWLFLGTEVMFFGGLFLAYSVYRAYYPEEFSAASRHLDVLLGGINTVVLLTSSLTMAMAVREAQLRRRKPLVGYLIATMILGGAFLGIKSVEYYHEYQEHLIPRLGFDWAIAERERPSASARDPEGAASAASSVESHSSPVADAQLGTLISASTFASRCELFFVLYFFMTGLHAIHLIIGIVLVGVIATLASRGWLSGCGETHVEVTGLYWHFIDIVWIFLYPLLYLIDVRP
jgi:cytochrome c oxidase subunit 3